MSSKNSRSISSNWLTRVSDEIEALNEIYLDTFKLITPNQTIQIKKKPDLRPGRTQINFKHNYETTFLLYYIIYG